MLPDKITLKLSYYEATTLKNILEAALLQLKPGNYAKLNTNQLLLLLLLSEVYRKLHTKVLFFRKVEMTLTLPLPQAVAFYLFFHNEYYSNEFTKNLIETICRNILQKIV